MSVGARLCPACQQVSMLTFQEGDLEIDSCPSVSASGLTARNCANLSPPPPWPRRSFRRTVALKSCAANPARAAKLATVRAARSLAESPVGSVQVDVCFRCRGIWLDSGELSRLVSQYKAGERGNLVVLNQIAEGLRELRRSGPPYG